MVADGLTRIFQLDYEKLPEKIKCCFKEDTTQCMFRMEEEDVEDANPANSDETLIIKRNSFLIRHNYCINV